MKLFFQTHGDGFPLLVLHGLFGSLDNWHTLSRILGSRFRVFSIDLRNHGRSPHSDIFTYAAMSDDVREFLDEHGLASVDMIGHSMGGKTAMRLSLDHPDRLNRVVIVDIAPKSYPGRHDHILEALAGLNLRTFSSRREIDDSLSRAIPSLTTRQFLLKNLKRDQNGMFAWKMNLEAIEKNYEHVNESVESSAPFEKPALFLRSTQSGYIDSDDIPSIKKLFPNSTFVDLNVGHWIHAEAPDRFAKIVLDFFLQAE